MRIFGGLWAWVAYRIWALYMFEALDFLLELDEFDQVGNVTVSPKLWYTPGDCPDGPDISYSVLM